MSKEEVFYSLVGTEKRKQIILEHPYGQVATMVNPRSPRSWSHGAFSCVRKRAIKQRLTQINLKLQMVKGKSIGHYCLYKRGDSEYMGVSRKASGGRDI